MANTTVRHLLSDGGRPLLQRLRQQHSRQLSLPLPSGGFGASLPSGLEPLPEGFTSGSSASDSLPSTGQGAHSASNSLQPGPALAGQQSTASQRHEREASAAAAAAAAVAAVLPEPQASLPLSGSLGAARAADSSLWASGSSFGAASRSAASGEQLSPVPPAPAPAGFGAAPSTAAVVAGGSCASSPRPASPQYRHVVVGPSARSGSGSSLTSPPPSPFESVSGRLSTFSSARSGDLGPVAAVEGTLALPGAPTMPAALPYSVVSGPRSTSQASLQPGGSALPGAPTVLAAQPLIRATPQQQGSSGGGTGTPAAGPAAQDLAAARADGSGADGDASLAAAGAASAGPGAGPAELEPGLSAPMPMHPLCPLHDDALPLDTASLKSQQLAHGLELLQQAGEEGEPCGRWGQPGVQHLPCTALPALAL